ncbi:GTP cyclohydrolase I FolE [Streptomyces solincola]|uniref:GTP cyclohydrolase 1 n=1 Tax=Streptomyces solincola TaxID=2100817 RepID=A0A2S9Q2B8_9ACTN|nr:GTP cyclohydrolase I FolE [Streptomyces solincola]PRH80778.1 GTP cyclohydrolase I FolE [Streptomyces solincola]
MEKSPSIDMQAGINAARDFLLAMGLSLDSPNLQDTPRRMTEAYRELLSPRRFQLTTFPNDEGYEELVVARSIPVRTVCEHHMLPFVGTAHVAYLPRERIVGLSKLARLVEFYAHRPQVQERLTRQVADWLDDKLHPKAVGVVIEATHSCMTLRGVTAVGSTTVTSTLLGTLREDPGLRTEFLSLIGLPQHR